MKRTSRQRTSRGFTLVELMTATALTLIVMTILATVFVKITNSITNSRASIELSSRLTAAAHRLQKDLEGHTVFPDPLPARDYTDGYLSIIEGPIRTGSLQAAGNNYAPQTTGSRTYVLPIYWPIQEPPGLPDTTLGDRDDVLSLTCRSTTEPFVGRFGTDPSTGAPGTFTSEVAEVVWFLRGTTLYRRVLLVGNPTVPSGGGFAPVAWWENSGDQYVRTAGGVVSQGSWPGGVFYNFADIAVHRSPLTGRWMPNTLTDLTVHSRRFWNTPDPRVWGSLGMPTMAENGGVNTSGVPGWGNWDRLTAPHAFTNVSNLNPQTGWTNNNLREGEDVILTNVIGFDIKVWDPGAPVLANGTEAVLPEDPKYPANPTGVNPIAYGAFVDLGYAPDYNSSGAPIQSQFCHYGMTNSPLVVTGNTPQCVYDTWTDFYERDGNGADTGLNGFDDNGILGIDDIQEWETPPPYPFPLRGVKITVRVIDPDTDLVREVSVVQDFILE